jgi:hypothetical protein
MAGSKSAYLEKKLLDHTLGNTAYTAPGTVYVLLSTSVFDPTVTGSTVAEVSGGSYARQSLTNNTTNFPNASGSSPSAKSNGTGVSFPTATASWGTIQSVYLVDASSGGNILYGADLSAPATINTGSSFSIPAGQFVFAET